MECEHCQGLLPRAPTECSACQQGLWCSVECQHAGRKAHKRACRAAQLARMGETEAGDRAGDAARCCDHCGAQPPELLECTGCNAVRYCTTECQLEAWLGHKKECRAVQKQRSKQEQTKLAGSACDVCGAQSPEVFACPACELAHYCSQQHQHDAWRGHKKACRQAVQEQAAATESAGPQLLALPAPMSTSQPDTSCGFCGTASAALLICSQCKTLRYCNADHQEQHWSTHKPECQRMAVEMASRVERVFEPTAQLALPAPPPSIPTTPACDFCGATEEKLLLCSKCKSVRYCNADHQKQHWAEHMVYCVAPTPALPKALLSPEMYSRNKRAQSLVDALRAPVSDEKRVLVTVSCLQSAMLQDRSLFSEFVHLGGVHELFSTLRKHGSHVKISASGLRVFNTIVSDRGNVMVFVEQGGLEVLFAVLCNHPNDPDVNSAACSALSEITAVKNENLSARGDICLQVLNALRNHSLHGEINNSACRALANLAANDDNNRKLIVALGGLELIFAAISNHPTHVGVNLFACRALVNLAHNYENGGEIVMRGGLRAIYTAMRNHPLHADVTSLACQALGSVGVDCEDDPTIVAGGFELIIAAVRNHPLHADVNCYACMALGSVDVFEENKEAIVARGGLEMIFAAMRQFPANVSLNSCACSALADLFGCAGNPKLIVAQGGIELILGAMRNHPVCDDVNQYGCEALAKLAEYCAYSRQAIMARGGLKLIFAAIRNHPRHTDLNLSAGSALASLAVDTHIQRTMLENGVLTVIFASMSDNLNNDDIVEIYFEVLVKFAENADNHAAIVSQGGLEALDLVCGRDPTGSYGDGAICRVFMHLASTHRQVVENRVGLAFVVKYLKKFPTSALQAQGRLLGLI